MSQNYVLCCKKPIDRLDRHKTITVPWLVTAINTAKREAHLLEMLPEYVRELNGTSLNDTFDRKLQKNLEKDSNVAYLRCRYCIGTVAENVKSVQLSFLYLCSSTEKS